MPHSPEPVNAKHCLIEPTLPRIGHIYGDRKGRPLTNHCGSHQERPPSTKYAVSTPAQNIIHHFPHVNWESCIFVGSEWDDSLKAYSPGGRAPPALDLGVTCPAWMRGPMVLFPISCLGHRRRERPWKGRWFGECRMVRLAMERLTWIGRLGNFTLPARLDVRGPQEMAYYLQSLRILRGVCGN